MIQVVSGVRQPRSCGTRGHCDLFTFTDPSALKAWYSHSPLRFSGGYSAPLPDDHQSGVVDRWRARQKLADPEVRQARRAGRRDAGHAAGTQRSV